MIARVILLLSLGLARGAVALEVPETAGTVIRAAAEAAEVAEAADTGVAGSHECTTERHGKIYLARVVWLAWPAG